MISTFHIPFRRNRPVQTILHFAILILTSSIATLRAAELPPSISTVIESTCLDCHDSSTKEGNLDLESLAFDLSDRDSFAQWVKVHDRVAAGEMPPADYGELESSEKQSLTRELGDRLRRANRDEQLRSGRVRYRRLNRVEYEHTLRDLFAMPQLEVADMLPADPSAHGFDKVGAALDLSHVQMARYLEAASAAVDKAMALQPKVQTHVTRLEATSHGRLSQVAGKGREAITIDNYVGVLRQPNTAQTPWFWGGKFSPPVAAKYKLRLKTFGFYWDKGEVKPADQTHVVTLQGRYGSRFRNLASFDVPKTQAEAATLECETFLYPGEKLQIHIETLDDRNKPGKLALDDYSAPGVAFEWIEIEGPLHNQWPPRSHQRLFGDLPIEPWTPETGLKEPPIPMIVKGSGKRAKLQPANRSKITLYHVVSNNPREDAARLLLSFAEKAFRRPVEESELDDVLKLVQTKIEQRYCFQEAMRIGYQAILCSPEFLFLQEQPGRLTDHALASRLSYFLWNSLPDESLLALAAANQLHQPEVLRAEVQRMLDDRKSSRFVENFTDQWLDLRDITTTQPDEDLYPEFDHLLLHSMIEETRSYFARMLRDDLDASHLVDSDFAMINGRLAELYGIPGVDGVRIRPVDLPQDSVRGGLLTQAAILKVTANGTTTSPVVRGAWVVDRLLGQPVPPPPPNVPAVEPDLRGAVTIRQQLAKHRDNAGCASCHRKMDPPGFALECFDVIGGYRDRYRSLGEGETVDKTFKNNRPVKYKLGLPVDTSGVAHTGESFADVEEFREILLSQKEQLARSLAEKLLVYATGAGISFADRAAVEQILEQTEPEDYGLRSLVHAVVQSETFQRK